MRQLFDRNLPAFIQTLLRWRRSWRKYLKSRIAVISSISITWDRNNTTTTGSCWLTRNYNEKAAKYFQIHFQFSIDFSWSLFPDFAIFRDKKRLVWPLAALRRLLDEPQVSYSEEPHARNEKKKTNKNLTGSLYKSQSSCAFYKTPCIAINWYGQYKQLAHDC